jgi:hypothetical protein
LKTMEIMNVGRNQYFPQTRNREKIRARKKNKE